MLNYVNNYTNNSVNINNSYTTICIPQSTSSLQSFAQTDSRVDRTLLKEAARHQTDIPRQRLVSRVSCHVSCVLCLVSRVLCLVSCVSCLVSCVSCHVSGVSCLVSCVTCLATHADICMVDFPEDIILPMYQRSLQCSELLCERVKHLSSDDVPTCCSVCRLIPEVDTS
ncbi:hypothetical protein C0Q70_18499 [Pomacea canaliculata]|uniref:Uncharacterized protein n=1 Tax=Pomacea canaliculata TaxID=400727 RepID=A0A2T7NGR7_POMCA|nr:hypothetical protein C0Q70_18499 [Pomacea canaliculata]